MGNSKGLRVLGACPKCKQPYSLKSGKEGPLGPRKCPACNAEHGEYILPNRILIEPVSYFENPVDDNTAYINHTNHGMLWTMLFRKTFGAGCARSITHILPEENEKLSRLLARVNTKGPVKGYPFKPYLKPEGIKGKTLNLKFSGGPEFQFESILEAWFMANVDGRDSVLRSVLGPVNELEYWGNNVLYGIGGEKVDVLCLHTREGVRFKATVVELKKGPITDDALAQIDDYGYWVAQLATAYLKDSIPRLDVQPVLVGRGTRPRTIESIKAYRPQSFEIPVKPPCKITVRRPILLEYELKTNIVTLENVAAA